MNAQTIVGIMFILLTGACLLTIITFGLTLADEIVDWLERRD